MFILNLKITVLTHIELCLFLLCESIYILTETHLRPRAIGYGGIEGGKLNVRVIYPLVIFTGEVLRIGHVCALKIFYAVMHIVFGGRIVFVILFAHNYLIFSEAALSRSPFVAIIPQKTVFYVMIVAAFELFYCIFWRIMLKYRMKSSSQSL